MTGRITANEYPLAKIFSPDFEYTIPQYQRPYSWTKDESGLLFEDLKDAYRSVPDENYFIGSLVLIKNEKSPRADVVDGQQRLTTLTILIAAIIKCFKTEKYKNSFIPYLKQPEDFARNLAEHPRLNVRSKDKDFFNSYILNYDFDRLPEVRIDPKKESVKNLKQNAELLYAKLQKHFTSETDLLKFGQFLINNCRLVVVTSENQESASRIFSVLNSRGLDLLPTDILKAEIIEKIPLDEQDEYTRRWELWEENLSRDGFVELFSHIRMIYAKNKAIKSILEEFRMHVVKKMSDEKSLINNVIGPMANAFDTIINENYKSNKPVFDKQINNSLFWLNQIDVSDWKPVALAFYTKHSNEPEYLNWFFKKLERLAAVLFITAASTQERITRFAEVLEEIEKSKDTYQQPLIAIELTDDEKNEALQVLNCDIYDKLTWMRCKYIVMRLNSFVSDVEISYMPNILSIEHVLPQTMNDDWKKNWAENEHNEWINKIANLVLLNRRKNSQAQNYSFEQKKEKYFLVNGTCPFPLTSQVLMIETWLPIDLKKRQMDLINVFKEKWEL